MPIRGNDFHTLRSVQFSYLIHPFGSSFLRQNLITPTKVLFKQASWVKTNVQMNTVAAGRKKRKQYLTNTLFRHLFPTGALVNSFKINMPVSKCCRLLVWAKRLDVNFYFRQTWFHTTALQLYSNWRNTWDVWLLLSGVQTGCFHTERSVGCFWLHVLVKGTCQMAAIHQTVYSEESLQMGCITQRRTRRCCLF